VANDISKSLAAKFSFNIKGLYDSHLSLCEHSPFPRVVSFRIEMPRVRCSPQKYC